MTAEPANDNPVDEFTGDLDFLRAEVRETLLALARRTPLRNDEFGCALIVQTVRKRLEEIEADLAAVWE